MRTHLIHSAQSRFNPSQQVTLSYQPASFDDEGNMIPARYIVATANTSRNFRTYEFAFTTFKGKAAQ